ncbi:MAG TPA: hypothetical protein VHY33_10320 [Thermoanaerobaculia bacterium]|jgi:hypothetical protein|nr:hypothetical protein [Thermoanaerobaculia bacterium]
MRIRYLAIAILIAIVAASCSQQSEEESVALHKLATDAEAFFKAADAGATIEDNRLVLSLVASNAGRLPGAERLYAAHEVALWAKRSYPRSDKLASITVLFVERHWWPTYWTTTERFDFTVKGLEQIAMPSSDR